MGGKRVRACAGPTGPAPPFYRKKINFETSFNKKTFLQKVKEFYLKWSWFEIRNVWNSAKKQKVWFCSNWKQFQMWYKNKILVLLFLFSILEFVNKIHFCSFLKFAKKYLIFFSNSKMLKKRYGSVSVSDMNPRKTCMVPLLYPAQNGTNEKCYGSVFGSVSYRNHGSESWSSFCSLFERVDQLELLKKNSQIVDQLLWSILVCHDSTLHNSTVNIEPTSDSTLHNSTEP